MRKTYMRHTNKSIVRLRAATLFGAAAVAPAAMS
jgi:hypothetical protein